jgi:hypothetical protein
MPHIMTVQQDVLFINHGNIPYLIHTQTVASTKSYTGTALARLLSRACSAYLGLICFGLFPLT